MWALGRWKRPNLYTFPRCSKQIRQNFSVELIGDVLSDLCPHGDLFRTPLKGKTSRQDYALNDNFELGNRQVSPMLPT